MKNNLSSNGKTVLPLVYTLAPSVWHWGFESTITWQKSSINRNGFTTHTYSLSMVVGGLTLVNVSFNYKIQLNRFDKELRLCFIASK